MSQLPSEIIEEMYKSKLPENSKGTFGGGYEKTFFLQAYISAILEYLDEQHLKNQACSQKCQHEFIPYGMNDESMECSKCHVFIS